MTTSMTAIVAEDEDFIRKGLIRKIEQSKLDITIIGEATDGREALQLIQEQQPHVLITDIRMPVMNGLQLIEKVHTNYPRTSVIITSGFADFDYARQAMKFEVKHYLLKPIKHAELYSALYELYTNLSIGPVAESADTKQVVASIQAYLREHYNQDISLEQLAQQFHFSSAYLSKIFIKHTGEPPSKYITHLRIHEAKQLLKYRKDLPIKTVGERVGYPDQYYFSRLFKQLTGVTPRDYQKCSSNAML